MEKEVSNYSCGNCKYYHNCKRIDHETVKFAVPWFKSYDRNQHSGIICCEFEPAEWCIYACKVWDGFENYWKLYVEQWLPYKNTNINVYFTINNDTRICYGVPLLDYVYGTMFDGKKLKAVEKMYYKRVKTSNTGYQLVREDIKGVELNN